ncbi:RNA polymerase sigma factor [Nocardioides cynanchi]|uniref:RNA polymerase sigma factor n=1 Tax=Nocardioides cynanchi TaxID=2558918 RepID=UPI0012440154|nr:sigma factor-like helix-turn-helix DNA-binding protein [Nocardioides cynanchi]
MAKTFRKRAPALLDLVDEPPVASSGPGPGPAPVVALEPFEAFYRREYPRLLVLARALTGAAGAEDVAQETMMVAYRRWADIALLDSPAGYVRGICLHQGRSAVRRLRTESRALQRYAVRPTARLEPLDPDAERYWAEVRRLPRRQAQATVLFYALDLPVAEIATTLGCAEGSVKTHLSRARATLAARLTDTEGPA